MLQSARSFFYYPKLLPGGWCTGWRTGNKVKSLLLIPDSRFRTLAPAVGEKSVHPLTGNDGIAGIILNSWVLPRTALQSSNIYRLTAIYVTCPLTMICIYLIIINQQFFAPLLLQCGLDRRTSRSNEGDPESVIQPILYNLALKTLCNI